MLGPPAHDAHREERHSADQLMCSSRHGKVLPHDSQTRMKCPCMIAAHTPSVDPGTRCLSSATEAHKQC